MKRCLKTVAFVLAVAGFITALTAKAKAGDLELWQKMTPRQLAYGIAKALNVEVKGLVSVELPWGRNLLGD
ncbi:MAG TPA: hypothetical protein VFV50_02730, partial [Bdellovibrionales bacterium]|nr:hypothetical protein [Bdellovibrionales bacterium]